MLTLLRKIVLLIVVCVFLITSTLAQKNKKKSSSKTPLEISQTIPSLIDNENVLDYFIREMQNVDYYAFGGNDEKKREVVHIDSLLPQYKKYVDGFINRYSRQINAGKEELKREPFKIIYDKIGKLRKINYKLRSIPELTEILKSIAYLPNSKEKVELLLEYSSLASINNNTYYTVIYEFCYTVKEIADKVNNQYEKGKAYTSLGDFAFYYKIYDFALQMYYLARESFDNSNKDDKTKYYEQGLLCNSISKIFNEVRLQQATEKEQLYSVNASQYFEKSGHSGKAESVAMYTITTNAFLWVNFFQYNSTETSKNTNNLALEALRTWYRSFKENIKFEDESNYLGFCGIGIYLSGIDKNIALRYYLQSLPYATFGSNTNQLIAILDNISSTYASLGRNDLAIGYSDLELYLTKKINDNFEFNKALLNKGLTFYELKEYDSALTYANKILFDTSLKIFYPVFYDQLLEKASELKYLTLDLRKQNNDSARQYERTYIRYQTYNLQNLIKLVNVELKSINDWLTRSKDKVITNEKELKETALLSEKLATKLKKEAIEKSKQDSIAKVQSDSISILNKQIASLARDSTKDALGSAIKEKAQREKVEKLNAEISSKNSLLTWAIAAVSLLLIVSVVLYFKNKITSKKLLNTSTSDLRLRSAIGNHNISNHYGKIKDMVRDTRITELDDYCEANSTYFDKFYNFLLKDVTSIEQELEVLTLFVNTEKIYKQVDVEIIYHSNGLNITKTAFLSDILVPLYENSLLKGFTRKDKRYQFVIDFYQNDKILYCKIFDNGEGVANVNSAVRTNSYLDMLNQRLTNYFKIKKISIPETNVFTINSKIHEGTQIKFMMPYDTIKNSHS